ncbi:ABC transporter substrate-binding protein [Thiolapillus sp.]
MKISNMLLAALTGIMLPAAALASDPGIEPGLVRIAGVMDLEGRSRGLGKGMKKGIEAAIKDRSVNGRKIEFLTANDSYTPSKTIIATKAMLQEKPFVFIGNVGTPTAKVSLPILAEAKVPAVGFFTGAGLLRPGKGPILNYRASYVQETAAVINRALDNGVPAKAICAYVQNDAYGMAGVTGILRALRGKPGAEHAAAALEEVLAMQGENPPRNGVGPVGVYQRNTFTARPGFDSLKAWEQKENTQCEVVVTVGAYQSIAKFAGYSRYKGRDWAISAVSFTGAENFANALRANKATDNILMTQVVPPLDSDLPIVADARKALGDSLGYVTLEGYIVGRMFLHILEDAGEEPTRKSFMNAALGKKFDLGGLVLDFTDDNQASDLVVLTRLAPDGWKTLGNDQWIK